MRGSDDVIGMEMMGQRAVVMGDWKLIWLRAPFGDGWELFNVAKDPGEQNNLALVETEKYQELLMEWDRYVVLNNIVLPEGPLKIAE